MSRKKINKSGNFCLSVRITESYHTINQAVLTIVNK